MADKFDIIAKIAGKTEGRTQSDKPKDTIKLELEESDGKKFSWTSFHVSEFQTLKIGSTHRFTVSRKPHKDPKSQPYRNVEAHVGPAEMPASGEMTSLGKGMPTDTAGAAGGGGAAGNRGTSPADKYAELISIESQGSIGTILRLIESGMTLEEAEEAVPKVLELALKVEQHHAGAPMRRPSPASTSTTPAKSPSTNGAVSTAKIDIDGIEKVENLGQFLTLCQKNYPSHQAHLRDDIEKALHMSLEDLTDFKGAWAQLGEHWEGSAETADSST